MNNINKYGDEQFENEEDFADKQVVDNLLKEFQSEVKKLNSVIRTQSNLIDNLSAYEKVITNKIIDLRKDDGKLLKQIKVNKANHFLLEDNFNKLNVELIKTNLRLDLIDKFIQNFLKKQNGVKK